MSLRLGNQRLEIDQETEMIKNNPEANRIAAGQYREGFQLPEIA
jgi:hypothetical protein